MVLAVWKLMAKFHVFHFSYVNSIFRPDLLFLTAILLEMASCSLKIGRQNDTVWNSAFEVTPWDGGSLL